VFIIGGLVAFSMAAGQETSKPIGPEEAAKKVNEKVQVLMEVKSAKLTKKVCFLNSEEDYKDAKNFTLFIDEETLAKFKEAKIEDPAAHFKGKLVEVKGSVTLYRDRPEIKLTGPSDIKVIEKKKDADKDKEKVKDKAKVKDKEKNS
jgi:DNA/RNA endonuclease YhcR with UshA esterase domain